MGGWEATIAWFNVIPGSTTLLLPGNFLETQISRAGEMTQWVEFDMQV